MGEWPEYPLETFVDPERSICYGIVQPGKPQDDGLPVIRVNNFKEGRVDTRDVLKIDPEIEQNYRRSRLRGGELLLTLVGSMGLSAIVPNELRGWNVARAVGVVPLKDNVDKRWLNFVLRSKPSQDYIETHANTTVQATFNLRDLARLPIPMPPDSVRLPASQLLSALDDKIELNRRMNETLEATARAIFKDWFVDFGPTRAKAEGRSPYLAPEIWERFPDALDDSGKPVGWELSEIGTEVEAVGGATPSTKEPALWDDGEHHWATPKDLSKLTSPVLLDTDRKIADAGIKKISSGLLPVGTVLLSSRAPIGYLAIAEVPTAINQGFIAMVCRKRLPNVFVLFWCYENLDYIKGISGGSTFAEISKKAFRPVPVVVPSEQTLSAYEGLARPLYDRIVANTKESAALAQTRDLLLPKLMSGEVRIREVEEVVGAVA